MQTQADSLRSKLKASTQGAHTQIESNPVLSKLTSTTLQAQEYRAILLRYFGFFDSIERTLRANGIENEISDFSMRVRAPRLHSDLLALGLSEEELSAAPRCNDLPGTTTRSQRFGVMYVTEGSTLGGMLIAKHLRTFDFFTDENGSFFTDHPQVISARWKAFIETLEGASDLNEGETLQAAADTFKKLDLWMSGART